MTISFNESFLIGLSEAEITRLNALAQIQKSIAYFKSSIAESKQAIDNIANYNLKSYYDKSASDITDLIILHKQELQTQERLLEDVLNGSKESEEDTVKILQSNLSWFEDLKKQALKLLEWVGEELKKQIEKYLQEVIDYLIEKIKILIKEL